MEENVAIPFISYTPEHGFKLNDEVVGFLETLQQRIGVISVCGKYRTGKSYLLNKLFLENLNQEEPTKPRKVGFNVGPTIEPCTKGLWIWKETFYAPQDSRKELPILIIDTEGLGAFDEEENHDAKIFLLAILLSSLLVYNSVGSIDENALNNLSLVVNLSKTLQIKSGEKVEDPDEMAEYFPVFYWVVRDFALQLRDMEGNEITSKTYLENALKEQKGTSDSIENKNRIRRLIRLFFKDRDCFTLVRPVEDERNLQKLEGLDPSALREEFVEQLGQLKSKTLRKVKPKQIRGKYVNGPMLY